MGFLKIAADKLGSYLRDELVMVGQVGAAVHAAVAAVARVQVGLERLGFRQLHHDCGGGDRIVRVGVCSASDLQRRPITADQIICRNLCVCLEGFRLFIDVSQIQIINVPFS